MITDVSYLSPPSVRPLVAEHRAKHRRIVFDSVFILAACPG